MQLPTHAPQIADVLGGFVRTLPTRQPSATLFGEAIFRKSVAGHLEIEHRGMFLRPELRRLLIMIDGHTAFDDFAPYFRSGDLPGLVDELVALGLIEPHTAEPMLRRSTLSDALPATHSFSATQIEAVRQSALHATNELLGRYAQPYRDRLERSADTGQLRSVLDDICSRLSQLVGSDAVTLFVETIRDSATTPTA